MITVEKIGGSCMLRFAEVLENVILNPKNYTKKNNPYNRIFILSAYGNVTNLLLEDKKTGKEGLYHKFIKNNDYKKETKKLLNHLLGINQGLTSLGLNLEQANEFIVQRINKVLELLSSLSTLLSSGYIIKENLFRVAREIIASIGESHSCFNSANILSNLGYKTVFLDLSGFNDNQALTIDERLLTELRNIKVNEQIPFVTGYVKGVDGIMRKFDRGYSDITFSKITVIFKKELQMKVKEAIIHKEFHLSSADPKIVGAENALPVGLTNYDVADQLADVGMEAIHPQASKPLEKNNINIRIKNTFESNHIGTLITKNYKGSKAKIEIITGTKKVNLLEVHDPDMVGHVGFDKKISEILFKHKISFILKSTNANSISQVLWEKQVSKELLADLEENFFSITNINVAIVSVIGTNISIPGILAQAANVLSSSNINIKSIAQSLRQVNMQFVIARKDYEKAIISLNNYFFNYGK